MYAHIAAWEASGAAQMEYIVQHGLSKSVFGYWLRKYRQDQAIRLGSFISVGAPDEGRSPSVGFACIRLSNGSELIFTDVVSAAYLRELLGW